MNALTQQRGQTAALPAIPQSLHRLIAASRPTRFPGDPSNPGSGFVMRAQPISPTADEVTEANRILAIYDSAAPVSHNVARRWLMSLNATVANTQTQDAFDLRLAALGHIFSDYPAAVFCQATLTEAVRTFKFFPSGAELTELLDRHASEFRETAAGLRRIATVRSAEPERDWERPGDAERAAVAAKLSEWRREQTAVRDATTAAEPRRNTLSAPMISDHTLLAIHEAEEARGNKASALRAAGLRRKLGIEGREMRA